MNRRPKMVVVGDKLLSPDVIKQNLAPVLKDDWELITCWYGPDDLGELDRELTKVEEFGPGAVPEPEYLNRHLKDADLLLVHMCPVSASLLKANPNLMAVGVLRGGTENVDSLAAKELGIPVFHTRGRTSESVSDFTIGLMLTEIRNISRAHAEIRNGHWPKEFPNSEHIPEMRELIIGLIGYGEVGKLVAKKLSGFGSRVQVYDPYLENSYIEETGVEVSSLDELLRTSDIISLHARHTHGVPPLLGKEEFEKVKPNVYIINTARAGLVDKDSLIYHLQNGSVMGAALDVFDEEPIPKDDLILKLPNVTLTSHIAFDSSSFYKRSPVLWWDGVINTLFNDNDRTCINSSEEIKCNLDKLKNILSQPLY